MKILVIGAGAIGGFIGGKLAASGQTVTFVDRPSTTALIRINGLRIVEPEGEFTLQPAVTADLAEAFAGGPADLVLVCVKTFDTQAVVSALRPYGSHIRRLLTPQNGLGNEEMLAEAFGADKVIAGTLTHPVAVPEPGVVRSEKKTGGIGLAPVRAGDIAPWVQALNRAGIVTLAYDDYGSMKWSKLLLNIIGNASSAILNMNTVQVFNDARLVALEVAQLREAIAVMRALGHTPVALPGYPVQLLAAAIRWLPAPLVGMAMRPLVVKGRAEKLPSLLIELNRNSGRSEVDDLNGAIVREGRKAGVPTPVNATLTATLALLTTMPSQRMAWSYNVERLALVAKGAQKEARQKK